MKEGIVIRSEGTVLLTDGIVLYTERPLFLRRESSF